MDYVTILRKCSPLARKAYRYVRDDLDARYGLREAAWAVFRGDGIGVLGRSLEVHTVRVGVLDITFVSEDRVRLDSRPFKPESGLWNGPNGIPDNLGDGSFEMSLWHDLVWEYAKKIAEILGVSEQKVMKWANGILAAAYRGYGEKRGKKSGWRAWIAYNVCERSRRWWHRLFPALLAALALGILAGCSGCASPPDWDLEDSNLTEVLDGQ